MQMNAVLVAADAVMSAIVVVRSQVAMDLVRRHCGEDDKDGACSWYHGCYDCE